jgi:hypothetical protein
MDKIVDGETCLGTTEELLCKFEVVTDGTSDGVAILGAIFVFPFAHVFEPL